jgi:murein DD-endopeptidase MepM/ murein hydrolase activator NlpD
MAKRYHYNPDTLQFDPVKPSAKRFVKRALIYLGIGLVTALPAVYGYLQKYSSLREQQLIHVNQKIKEAWTTLQADINKAYSALDTLVKKDDYYYRTILDLEPLSPSVREAGTGGIDKQIINHELVQSSHSRLEKLKHQIDVARQSFEQLQETTDRKLTMLASRPAIQPVNNKQLRALHLTFGKRLHPIFNVVQDHKGLDFSAAFGTPVYATADGRVSMAYFSSSYGNVVYVDHGFNYETRYAHLQRFKVQPGMHVKRGELIGYVGNTGISAAPHLHYEVFYKGNAVNPIHFFQRDLNQQEYQKIIQSPVQTSNP